MAFYLQIPGVKGAVTDSQHKEWIALHNVNFQVENHVTVKPGNAADRCGSVPSISDFTFTKLADVSSPKILESSLCAKVYDKVVMHVCNNDQKPYIELTLYKAIISNYDLEGIDAEEGVFTRLQETFNINAVKVEMRYIPHNATAISTGYDLEKMAMA